MLLQFRSHLYLATVFTTAFLSLAAYLLSPLVTGFEWLALLVFMDPAIIGLSFVGAFMLMERSGYSLSALAVTPLSAPVYLVGKIVSFTLLGTTSGVAVALAAVVASDGELNTGLIVFALTITNVLAVLIGITVSFGSKSVNDFLARLSITMVIVVLPVIAFLDVITGPGAAIFQIIPSYSMLFIINQALQKESVSLVGLGMHLCYLLVWIMATWLWNIKRFDHNIRTRAF